MSLIKTCAHSNFIWKLMSCNWAHLATTAGRHRATLHAQRQAVIVYNHVLGYNAKICSPTEFPILKGIYLVKIRKNWSLLRRQCSSAVEASRIGEREMGGTNPGTLYVCGMIVVKGEWAFFFSISDKLFLQRNYAKIHLVNCSFII